MRDMDGRLVLSLTDLTKHLACPHLISLDLAAAHGRLAKPDQQDDDIADTKLARRLKVPALLHRLEENHQADPGLPPGVTLPVGLKSDDPVLEPM